MHAAKHSIHEKQEGLRFLHICLASVLNLRSPDESELSGTPLDKLASMLFGTQVQLQTAASHCDHLTASFYLALLLANAEQHWPTSYCQSDTLQLC